MLGRFGAVTITEYNGYSFQGPEAVETRGYKITPVYDTARRTVIYSQFDITLHWYINGVDDVSDPRVVDMVARLQRPPAS